MKPKFIIAALVGIALIVLAALSFNKSMIDYTDFAGAQKAGKNVQVVGVWLKDKPTSYDAEKNTFVFYMADTNRTEKKVVFAGSKPNNFSQAPTIVVKGMFEGDDFKAVEILTKCPSKYESKVPTDIKN